MKLRYRIQNAARTVAEFAEDTWFDRSRNVQTSGNVSLRQAGIHGFDTNDSELYVPARPAHIREALGKIGIQDFSGYSYIDFGSGKGRSLFVAAEFPFAEIIGVELSHALHTQACANIQCFQWWKRRCGHIVALHMNATDFTFPRGQLVLYLFNPFGARTMQQVMKRLDASLQEQRRHVVVVLLWPRCGKQVAEVQGMRLIHQTQRHEIFESRPV